MSSNTDGGVPSRRPDVDALLQLIKRKPPPKIDGLVHLSNEKKAHFTSVERELLQQSEEGQVIESLSRCDGHRKIIRDARADWLKNRDDKTKFRKLNEERGKYVECLTYVACPIRWKQYSQCWSSLGNLPLEQLRQLQEYGPEFACQFERQSLELCVGSLVTKAVQSATSDHDFETGIDL